MSDGELFLLDPDRAPAVEHPGLAQIIDLLQHVASKRAEERRDMLAAATFTLSLDELLVLTTEISRQICDQLAARLMLRTEAEIAACREKIQQLQAAEPDGGTALMAQPIAACAELDDEARL